MKSYLNLLRSSAILIACLTVSDANADWLDAFTYDATVSNSPGGPFASSASLWSQNVPSGTAPSSITLYAENSPLIFVDTRNGVPGDQYVGDQVRLRIASIGWVLGVANYSTTIPLPQQLPYYIQLAFPDQKTVLTGELDSPNFFGMGTSHFKFLGPSTLTLGKTQYKITVESEPAVMPGAPVDANATSVLIGAYDLWAAIPLNEVAPTPEPASLVLAGIGVAGLIGFAWRRNRR